MQALAWVYNRQQLPYLYRVNQLSQNRFRSSICLRQYKCYAFLLNYVRNDDINFTNIQICFAQRNCLCHFHKQQDIHGNIHLIQITMLTLHTQHGKQVQLSYLALEGTSHHQVNLAIFAIDTMCSARYLITTYLVESLSTALGF